MEIADSVAHLALSYASGMQEQGYRLTVDEFESYMAQPSREPGRGPLVQRVRELPPAFRTVREVQKKLDLLFGTRGREEVIDPGSPRRDAVLPPTDPHVPVRAGDRARTGRRGA